MKTTGSLAALVLLVAVGAASAQSVDAPPANGAMPRPQPSPEDREKAIAAAFSQLGPMQVRVVEATLELETQYAARPETATRIATFKKNLFDALKKNGFTTEQAMQIVVATPLPAMR